MTGWNMTRRGMIAATAFTALTGPALALSQPDAESFVARVVNDVTALITSGRAPRDQARAFRSLFERDAAVPQVTRFVAGVTWRRMSDQQKQAFQAAFLDHVARTYTGLLSRYAGQKIRVTGSKDFGRRGILVYSVASGASVQNAKVEWLVSDRGGRTEMVDVIVEGISLLQSQRQEFASMLDKRGGDVDRFIADLRQG